MSANVYKPDNWVIIKIKGDAPHYRVLAGWSGGYLNGSSWRLNSGITSVVEDDSYLLFKGSSGSVYRCHKESYGLKMGNAQIWAAMKNRHGELVELMDEDTDWFKVDWILK